MKMPEQADQHVLPPPPQPLEEFRACLKAILLWVRGGRHGIVDVPSCLETIEQTAVELLALVCAVPELGGEDGTHDSACQKPARISP
jgi:hypothetical protein